MSPRQAHYVRANHVTRVPRNFIFLDTEAQQQRDGKGVVQTFRLGCARLDRRTHRDGGWREPERADFFNLESLWDWVDAHCQTKARTVLVAHKLDYDIRITDALRQLTGRGFGCEFLRLDAGQCWGTFKRGSQTLVMSDSLTWLNMGLDKVGPMVAIPKLALPSWDDTDEAWLARCRRDVEILAEAYRRIIDWIKREDMGNWRPTGAGQSWSAYRHRFRTHKLLVHDNEDAYEAERRAVWAGRCEAWRWGKQTGGPFTEWDFTAAYAHVGATCDVPTRLVGDSSTVTEAQYDKLTHRYRVLADVTVTTEAPTVPARKDERIVWPVGTFTTSLWDAEVQLAREAGATVTYQRAWWYVRRPAIAEFCAWCLSVLDERNADIDPIVRAVVKHWSRSLIGRFGARWSKWEQIGVAPSYDVALGWAKHGGSGDTWRMLQLGEQLLRESEVHDANDAMPSVMGYVMSECRARLWRACVLAGINNVAYIDTDSLIVNRTGHSALLAAPVDGLRVKGQWNTLEVLGPRQLIVGGKLRAAGVPRDAERVEPDVWEASVWTQFGTSIAHGESDRVRILPRRMRIRGLDRRRIHAPHGLTAAHRFEAA